MRKLCWCNEIQTRIYGRVIRQMTREQFLDWCKSITDINSNISVN